MTHERTTIPISPRVLTFIPLILAGMSMIGPFSIDTPFPAFAELQDTFDVGAAATQQLVSAYLLAFAAMSLFHGPISDAVGRRPVMIVGLSGYVLASVGCALAPSMGVLIACRAAQGLFAGGGVIVSRTIARDLYSGDRAQKLMSQVMMIFGLAPAVAPIIGGWLLQLGPWSVIFWFLSGFGVLLVAIVIFVLPETHPPADRIPLHVGAIVSGIAHIARTPAFHRIAWAGALAFGGQFLYIGSAPIFIVDLLGKGETDFWVFFVPMISGVVLGAWVSSRAAGRISGRRLATYGLLFAVAAAVLNLVLALLPTAAQLPHAVIGPALIGFGVAAAFPTLQLTVLDLFPHARGAAASGSTFFALILNAVTAGALAPLVTQSILTLAGTCLCFVVAGTSLWLWQMRTSRIVRTESVELPVADPTTQQ